MAFITDKQTRDELNLLGRYRQDSMYGLFNKTKIKGGDRLLEEFLQNPLTDKKLINERAATFRYFQNNPHNFPVDGDSVAAFTEWMDSDVAATGIGNVLSAFKQKALSSLVHDERYNQQQTGLKAALTTLHKLYDFFEKKLDKENISANLPASFLKEITAVKTFLSDKRIQNFRQLSGKANLSVTDTANYGKLLKSTMRKETENVLAFIYQLDVNIAVGSVGKEKNFNYAEAIGEENNDNKLLFKNLRHPALAKGIGNDLVLNRDNNLLFLTGANMAGKSTLMKSIGIALYLAHCGFPVAADAMQFTIKDGLYSSINVPDNISLGYSHFYAEVLRVKDAAKLVSEGKHMLVMFDELFKGTNVKDAYEGTLEVTKAFSKYRDCLFIISTHIIEVGEDLKDNSSIKFGYMPTVMEERLPRYTYKLTEGITEDRQGMLIIQNEGILELLA